MKLKAPEPIRFELPDGRAFVVNPPTIKALRDCMALDAKPADEENEDASAKLQRLAGQVAVLVGSAVNVNTLSFDEAMQVRTAVFAHANGLDPVGALAITNTIRAARGRMANGAQKEAR